MSTKYSSQRALAYGASALGFLIAATAIFLVWKEYDEAPARTIQTIMELAGSMSLSALALLVAWYASEARGAVIMALAIAFVGLADAWHLMQATHLPGLPMVEMTSALTFALGAGFFVRASQLFPRELTASDVTSGAAVLQRVRPIRTILVALLRPPAAWALAVAVAVAMPFVENSLIREPLRLVIVGAGIIYFYIGYRVGDAEARRKVLWFLEAAIGSLVVGVIAIGIIAVLGDGGSPIVRATLAIGFSAMYTMVVVACLYAAVFYAGAISPALVVRKTFVFGVTIAALLFAFATIEALVADLVATSLGINDRLTAALFGAACGLAFGPLKKRLERVLRKVLPASSEGQEPSGTTRPQVRAEATESSAGVN